MFSDLFNILIFLLNLEKLIIFNQIVNLIFNV